MYVTKAMHVIGKSAVYVSTRSEVSINNVNRETLVHAHPFEKIKVHLRIDKYRERGVCMCSFLILSFFLTKRTRLRTRVIFYVRRVGLYLYKYRIYGTISIYILKGLAFVYQLI